MAGFTSTNLNIVFIYINYCSPIYWGSNILSNIVFQDKLFECVGSNDCLLSNGNDVLKLYNLYNENISLYIWILLGITLIFVIITYTSVRIKCYFLNN